jgi:hypothetical protein
VRDAVADLFDRAPYSDVIGKIAHEVNHAEADVGFPLALVVVCK